MTRIGVERPALLPGRQHTPGAHLALQRAQHFLLLRRQQLPDRAHRTVAPLLQLAGKLPGGLHLLRGVGAEMSCREWWRQRRRRQGGGGGGRVAAAAAATAYERRAQLCS